MHVVVNHLHLRDPVAADTAAAAREAVQAVDDRRVRRAEDADRIAREVIASARSTA